MRRQSSELPPQFRPASSVVYDPAGFGQLRFLTLNWLATISEKPRTNCILAIGTVGAGCSIARTGRSPGSEALVGGKPSSNHPEEPATRHTRIWVGGLKAEGPYKVLREVLIISRNKDMTRWMQWSLEDLGLAVELSSSLEQSFLGAHSTPFMVVVDADVIADDEGHAKQYLAWFHRRSPILLVANSSSCEQLQEECDLCLPHAIGREAFLAGIRKLGGL